MIRLNKFLISQNFLKLNKIVGKINFFTFEMKLKLISFKGQLIFNVLKTSSLMRCE